MPVIDKNPYLVNARGMFGGHTVYRQLRGRTIFQARPKPTTKESVNQKDNRSQFAKASAYAKSIKLDPQLNEQYRIEAEKRKLPNPYTAALCLKLRELKSIAEDGDYADTVEKFADVGDHLPEPFENRDLQEYLLYSVTTSKRSHARYARQQRAVVKESTEPGRPEQSRTESDQQPSWALGRE